MIEKTSMCKKVLKVNRKLVEQFLGIYGKNMHFINKMNPATDMFMLQSVTDLNNEGAQ